MLALEKPPSRFVDTDTHLLEQLLNVSTPEDVQRIIRGFPDHTWHPVGDRSQNFPIINVGADPGDALVERITNGFDALIEREMARRGKEPGSLESPRAAAELLFGIPSGRLASVPTDRRRELAQAVQVALRDSGRPSRPTVVVRDAGIGQHPDAFPRTLVSPNENNKVERHELLGLTDRAAPPSTPSATMPCSY